MFVFFLFVRIMAGFILLFDLITRYLYIILLTEYNSKVVLRKMNAQEYETIVKEIDKLLAKFDKEKRKLAQGH